jgi:DNA-binding response OmpR family regulator
MTGRDDNRGNPTPPEAAAAALEFVPLQRFQSSQISPTDFAGEGAAVVTFRKFRAVPQSRALLADGEPVELGSRAFDLLMTLIEACGRLVTKDEIMGRVWPSTVVSENNVRVQIAALRRALGNDRDVIKTIPGRGYFFAAENVARQQAMTARSDRSPRDLRLSAASGERLEPEAATPVLVVVDDDPHIREALQGLLRSVGFHVETFSSIEELLACERLIRPACLILDVWLPGRNGLDFHADLAKFNAGLPVIFMSGHADVPMSVQAMKAGAIEFLTKPVRHQDILNAIEAALRPTEETRP